jgi:hypothetical protein
VGRCGGIVDGGGNAIGVVEAGGAEKVVVPESEFG